MKCETCWAWKKFPESSDRSSHGWCRRNAPISREESDDGRAIWPITFMGDRCGEWDDREPERKKRSL